jgi:(4S)-4-hydroxy-5-phosphonooxypentane-2,3-dione isomerase
MAYTVSVTWIAKEGEEDAVASALEQLIEPSRAEPGVIHYIPHRDPEDPRRFYLFEMYVDADAYAAHGESEHFKRLGRDDALPRLEERRREFFVPMA